MAGSERRLTVVLAGDTKSLDRAMSSATKSADGFGRRLGSVAKTAGLAFAGLGAGAVVLGKGFVDAAIESQKVTKQTDAVLKSMGDSAGVTSKHVADLSERLSMQSGVDDELIQSGQNLLLTFGKVQNRVGKSNKVFDRATKAALDMSVAMGTDMKGATIQVGKALNDPLKGITALSRAGVSFTQSQKDQIKWMVAAGDTMSAQKLILGELENQFGGSAEAQATAGERLKVVWGNLQEELGARLLPVVERLADWLARVLPPALDSLSRAVQPVLDQLGAFWNTLTTGFTEDEGTPFENAALGLRDAFAAVKTWLDDNGETIKTVVTDIFQSVMDVIKPTVALIRDELLPRFRDFATWLFTEGPGVEIAITAIAGAMALYATNAALAAAASLAAVWPFALAAAAIGGLYWAMIKLQEAFSAEISGALQFFVDHVLIPLKNAAEDVAAAIRTIINLGKDLPDLPNLGGGDSGGFFPTLPPVLDPTPGFNLPFLDDGGVMPGVRGVHYPAMVAGGETVLPTHKNPMAGSTVNLNFYGSQYRDPTNAVRELKRVQMLAGVA